MQKFIRISAIVAAALVAISIFLLLVSIPCQRLWGSVNHYPDTFLSALPIIPVIPFVTCFLQLGCMIPMMIASCRKGGIWLEILLFAAMALVIPGISSVMSTSYTAILGQTMGNDYLAANSVIAPLIGLCTSSANLGQCVAYAVCGMRIVSKLVHKKQSV